MSRGAVRHIRRAAVVVLCTLAAVLLAVGIALNVWLKGVPDRADRGTESDEVVVALKSKDDVGQSVLDEPSAAATDDVSADSEKNEAIGAVQPSVSIVPHLEVTNAASFVGSASNALGVRETWRASVSVIDASTSILEHYRDEGTGELAFSGYLDLLSEVWGCAVREPQGWVDVIVVDGRDSGEEECTITIERFGQSAIESVQANGS